MNYLIDHIQDYVGYILKKHRENIDNPPVQIYANKIENSITLKIKDRHRLELLTLETMKLLGSNQNKITKDKNGENILKLQK